MKDHPGKVDIFILSHFKLYRYVDISYLYFDLCIDNHIHIYISCSYFKFRYFIFIEIFHCFILCVPFPYAL